MKKIILLIMLILNSCQFLFAQVDTAWTRRFYGSFNNDDFVRDLAVDKKGNVYVTGSIWDTIGYTAQELIVTIKYNTLGSIDWIARYVYGDNQRGGNAIAVDTSGNVYVTGYVHDNFHGFQFITIKYDSSGNEIWVNFYDNGFDDSATDIALDIYGNVYVTGSSSGGNPSSYDFATIKYNNSGVQQWVARYSSPGYGNDFPYSIAVDDLGNVYVTGTSYDSTTFYDFVTVKYNSAGIEQWVKRFDDPGLYGYSKDDCAFAIAVDKQGNIVVTGGTQGTGQLGLPPDWFLVCTTIKYDANGDTLWVRKYDRGVGEWAEDLIINDWNEIYVLGTSYGSISSDYLLIKYNIAGDSIWVRHYNGLTLQSQDFAKSVALDKLGNIYITGKSGIEGNYQNFATVKYNPNGEEKWAIRYGEPVYPQWHRAVAVAVDDQFNVFVTGQSKGMGTYDDFLTIKYMQVPEVGTVLANNAVAGSQILEVADTSGFSNGDSIIINPGGLSEEKNRIISFGSIHLENPLQYNHYTGEQVMKFILTSVNDNETTVPGTFELYQNYPNPFNPSTKISWQSPVGSWQTLKVYDVLGNEVAILINEYKPAGKYEIDFNAVGLSSGIYLIKLETDNYVNTKKMILIK